MGRSAMEIEVRERLPSMLRRRTWLQGCAAAVAAAAVPVFAQKEDAPGLQPWRPVRMPALDATELQTGQRRTLADFAGHALVVNFWATWCAPCRVEMPSLNALADHLAPRGLRMVTVNHGEMPARVRQFMAETPIHGTALLDRSQGQMRAWGAQGLPASFVVDAQGRPRYRAMGELDWLAPQVVAAIESVI